MKKKASKPAESASSESASSPSTLQFVKGIKNTVFKNIAIGASGVVAGVCRAVARESGNYGDYWQMKGEFAAKVDGVTYRANTLYMPDVAADMVANAFLGAQESEAKRAESSGVETDKPRAVSVEFAIRLKKQKDTDPKNKNGFQWVAEPVKEIAAETDRAIALLTG